MKPIKKKPTPPPPPKKPISRHKDGPTAERMRQATKPAPKHHPGRQTMTETPPNTLLNRMGTGRATGKPDAPVTRAVPRPQDNSPRGVEASESDMTSSPNPRDPAVMEAQKKFREAHFGAMGNNQTVQGTPAPPPDPPVEAK